VIIRLLVLLSLMHQLMLVVDVDVIVACDFTAKRGFWLVPSAISWRWCWCCTSFLRMKDNDGWGRCRSNCCGLINCCCCCFCCSHVEYEWKATAHITSESDKAMSVATVGFRTRLNWCRVMPSWWCLFEWERRTNHQLFISDDSDVLLLYVALGTWHFWSDE